MIEFNIIKGYNFFLSVVNKIVSILVDKVVEMFKWMYSYLRRELLNIKGESF